MAAKENTPRAVKISFQVNNEVEISDVFEEFNLNNNFTRSEMIKHILGITTYEGAESNEVFTGVNLIDTMAEEKIYTMLSSSIVFSSIKNENKSPKDCIDDLRSIIEESSGGITGYNKLFLNKALSKMQPQGTLTSLDFKKMDRMLGLSNQNFPIKFNKMFFKDTIENASTFSNTIYEDEIRAMIPYSRSISQALIGTIDHSFTYEHDYEMRVFPYNIEYIDMSNTELSDIDEMITNLQNQASSAGEPLLESAFQEIYNKFENNPIELITSYANVPEIKIVGHIIQKSEILASGETIRHNPIFVAGNSKNINYLDKDVRYGSLISYSVRTLASCKNIIRVFNEYDDNSFRLAIGKFFVASGGKKHRVHCVENIPPPPPVRINAKIDYIHKAPILTWEFPLNPQRDIKKFQIFKRETKLINNNIVDALDQPFTLVAEYDFSNNFKNKSLENVNRDSYFKMLYPKTSYLDKEFNLNSDSAIYAIVSIDAHGMTSGYSNQLQIKYDKYSNKLIKKFVSKKEAPKPYPNLYIENDFFEDAIKSSGKKRCHIYFDPEYYGAFRNTSQIENITSLKDLNFLNFSNAKSNPYIFHFVNADMQLDQTLKIELHDKSGDVPEIPASDFNPVNFNFEIKI